MNVTVWGVLHAAVPRQLCSVNTYTTDRLRVNCPLWAFLLRRAADLFVAIETLEDEELLIDNKALTNADWLFVFQFCELFVTACMQTYLSTHDL